MELTEQQRRAVEHIGNPTLVVAGAGSGKTRTLTAKISHLIANGYEPDRILAITFTNKAAEEMKHRLEVLTGMPPFRFPWVRTYHSACFKILKEHCERLGFEKPLQIYPSYHQQNTVKEILLGMNFDKAKTAAVAAIISRAKNSGKPLDHLERKQKASRIPLIEVFRAYEATLRAKNAVDFDNILLLTRDLLRDHDDLRTRYQELFRYVLVDEYQDSNNLQEELTRLLVANGNLFCVGDDWQAIYGFRGSNVDHFLSFSSNYSRAKVFRLEENFRSANEIVQIANELIEFNRDRMKKRCFSKKRGGVVDFYEFYDESQEATWVSRKIKSLASTGIPLHRMAVLYRTKFCSLAFEKAFRYHQVPYQMMGAKGFFDRKEILDLNCYLTAAAFPKDDVSFERILNTPKRGIGPAMLKKINQVRTGDMGLQDAVRQLVAQRVLTPKMHETMSELIRTIDDMRSMAPETAVHAVLNRFGYMDYLRQYAKTKEDFIAREENIKQLLFTAAQHPTILAYLEEAALINEDREEDEEERTTGVKLSTIHASKGLEYQVVFVVACEENLFPHWRSAETPGGLQEERRLMYVAMTRAEEHLYISCAESRRGQFNARSRFLAEIERSLS